MTITYDSLIESKFAETGADPTSQYVSAGRTLIDKMTARNNGTTTATITVFLVPPGLTAGDANKFAEKMLNAGDEFNFPLVVGRALTPGGAIWTKCTGDSVAIGAAGRKIT